MMGIQLGNINLFVRDMEQAQQFYVDALGLVENVERSAPPGFVLLEAGACTVTLQDGSAPGAAFGPASSIELGFMVEDCEALRRRLVTWGASVSAVQQMGWGSGFDVTDPDGHRLTIYHMHKV